MNKETKDLGIKIETEENAFWILAREKTEEQIKELEKALKFQKGILEMTISKKK